ncbi:MarR family winged helix-turn-helix transcriptional regulator [Kineococcus auxinigenes]|uniref:MarR family winged helix-turn-helix transcriptional regulator n=1 Tax=unclassified Kineococcus TaxID=2621656 RepID=UPI003D7EEBBF
MPDDGGEDEGAAGAGGIPREVLAALEEEMAVRSQLRRARARELAHLLHPRLDPTAVPLIGVLGASGALRPSDLVRALHLDASTVSRQITAVERLGLVTRVPDPTDARARLVDLTAQAREQFTAYRDEQLDHWEHSFRGWSADDVQQLTRLLRRLREGR